MSPVCLYRRIATLAFTALVSCGHPPQPSSSLADSRDQSLDGESFEMVCFRIANGSAYSGAQREVALSTVKELWKRAKASQIPGLGSGELPSQVDCQKMFTAWEQRSLDLSRVGKVDMMVLAKLRGVYELDLSENGIDDSALAIWNPDTTSISLKLHEELRILNLAGNHLQATAAARLGWQNHFVNLQRLDLSRNQIKSVSDISLGDKVYHVSLAHNKDLEISTFKANDGDTSWEGASDLASMDLTGIRSVEFNAFYISNMRKISTLRLQDVGRVTIGSRRCTYDGFFPNLIFLNLARTGVDADVVQEFTKTDKNCAPSLAVAELGGSSQAGSQSTLDGDSRHPRPEAAPATCSGQIRMDFSSATLSDYYGIGRYLAASCDGSLTMPALGFTAAAAVSGRFPLEFPVYPLRR